MTLITRAGRPPLVRGVVFGAFDCLNPGHLDLIRDAKLDCDHLTVIIQSDIALIERRGYVQHSEQVRKEVLLALPEVDEVIRAQECDCMTVIPTIEKLVDTYPNDRISVFCGPETTPDSGPEEVSGCTYIYTLREKLYSTSELFDDARAMRMRNLAAPIQEQDHSENDYVVLDDCQIVNHQDD